HRRRMRHGWQPATVTSQPRAATSQAEKHAEKKADKKAEQLPTPITQPRETDLPIDVQVKVEQIRRKVDVLLGFADRFPPFSKDLYLVRQTASEYLPRTIDTYLALPKQTAEKPMTGNGKTALQELRA